MDNYGYCNVKRGVLVAASCCAGLTKPFGERIVVYLELSDLHTQTRTYKRIPYKRERERERENNNYTHAATHSNVILRPTKPIHHALGIIRQSLLCIYSVNIWWNVDSGGEDRELPSHQPKVCGTPQIPMDTGALPLPPEGVPALLTPTFISLIDVWKWYKIPLMFEKMPREILIRCERNVGHGAWPGCCTVSS